MKRLLLTVILMICGITCLQSKESEGFLYKIENNEVILLGCQDSPEKIVIPDTIENKPVTIIEHFAFCRNFKLKEVQPGANLREIRDYAFWFCTSLDNVCISENVTRIGIGVFDECSQMKNIYVCPANKAFTSIDGVLFTADRKKLVKVPYAKQGRYQIPDSVEVIGDGAFKECLGLTQIDFPDSVTTLENRALFSCSSLTELHLPKNLKVIGDYSLSDCSKLQTLVIPAGVQSIGYSAFSWCNNMKGIHFEGNAPNASSNVIGHFVPNYPPVYYKPGATGWNGGSWRSLRLLPEELSQKQ